jgi:acetyl-CoA carboxylase carboxyl transferase beta subunit
VGDHRRLEARDLVRRIADPGSWAGWDEPLVEAGPVDDAYAAELAEARRRTGLDESVITGEMRLGGRRVAVVATEFGFLAGTIGVAAAERLVRAVERATAEGLPVVASPTSGGTRMQEGTVAFLQMVKITAALAQHRAAGLPYLVYLRHPTTGGVFASFGSLGHVSAAQPGALIGFLGPRVYEALYDAPFPAGVQTAENLFAHGLIDAVVEPEALRDIAIRALDILCGAMPGVPAPPEAAREPDVVTDPAALPDVPAWDSITRSRRAERPGVRALLKVVARSVVPLNGTGQGETDPGLLLALARFGTAPCVLLGQDRRAGRDQPLGPAGLREARRGMRLAAELGLPLVSVIDTAGAALSQEAEQGGLAGEIARSLADLALLPAPTLCLLLGQGAGGGALALLPADRVVAAQHAWVSPLPPEGASAIVHRTVERAPEMAAAQGVRSRDLLRDGVVDAVVPERPDAADEAGLFLRRVGIVLERELLGLLAQDAGARLEARRARYRRLGLP